MHHLDQAAAERMAREVAAWVHAAGGTLFTVTSTDPNPDVGDDVVCPPFGSIVASK